MKKILLLCCLTVVSCAYGNIGLNSLFSHNMVMQRGISVPVWGVGEEGESVSVDFCGQRKTTVVIGGKWMIKLDPMTEGGPFVMIVRGKNVITIKNILIGEVWVCSGQSNMAFPLRSIKPRDGFDKLETITNEANLLSSIRQFTMPLLKSTSIPSKINDVKGNWKIADSNSVRNFSAVAYFFARKLYGELKVPIGIINVSYGGTAIENWIDLQRLEATPSLQSILTNFQKSVNNFSGVIEKYRAEEEAILSKYRQDSVAAVTGKTELPKSQPPAHPAERGGPGGLYNTMISPLMPFAIRGVLWYQGEANASRGIQYRKLLPLLIDNWRIDWGQGDFPFLIVQIPGWKAHQPELREAQLLTSQKVSNTSMVVINDCDDTLDVHPGNKQPVGERLFLAAMAKAYNTPVEYSGPIYQSMEIKGDKIVLSFSHVGAGLNAKGGELKDFTIAGADKVFVPAIAEIKGNKVWVYAKGISQPVAVRLGWRVSPQINLYNKDNLPATPFRTDVE